MSMNFFGTDGIRGPALEGPLSIQACTRWGRAWDSVARQRGIEELVIGWDPRSSSEPIVQAFLGGLGSLRACVIGMVPTPAVAWVCQRRERAWGLMVSASHNPPGDNGLKGFNEHGEKLEEEDEAALESAFEALGSLETHPAPPGPELPWMGEYLAHLGVLELPDSFPLVVDCAHGATAPWAPELLRGPVHWLGRPADGARINVGVGSTHLEGLQSEVRACGAAAGLAFDGDGDRCLFVDSKGELVDGDQLLWLLVQDRIAGSDAPPGVVGTLMSNGGLEQALREAGIPFLRTAVGDKYMLRELARQEWDLAAEASGHIIQKRLGPSGDGLATALSVLKALLHRDASKRWDWRFPSWPLRLLNLVARERIPLDECDRLKDSQRRLESTHGDSIRVVVRWSGTEPKLRLMVEARSEALVNGALLDLEGAARADLGLPPA